MDTRILKIALLFCFALLLGAPQSLASTTKEIARDTLLTHRESLGIFEKKVFRGPGPNKIRCAQNIQKSINELMKREEDIGLSFSLYMIAISDISTTATKQRPQLVSRQIKFLQMRSFFLQKRADARGGRIIAKGLLGHAGMLRYWRRGKTFNFCTLQKRIKELGGYTNDNVTRAMDETTKKTWGEWLAQGSWKRHFKTIKRSASIMSSLRNPLPEKSIDIFIYEWPLSAYGGSKYSLADHIASGGASRYHRPAVLFRIANDF